MGYSKSLLLIEDDKDLQVNLEYFLSKIGYRLFVASTGEEGVEVWRRERPRAVLLDINLPGMNGYKVCESIKQGGLNDETAVVFLSARPEHEMLAAGQRGGADFYILKPVDPVDIGSDLYFLFERNFDMNAAEALRLRVARKVPRLSRPPAPQPLAPAPREELVSTEWLPPPPRNGGGEAARARRSHTQVAASFDGEKWDHVSELLLELRRSLRRKHAHSMGHEELLELVVDTDRRVDAVLQYVELVHTD